MRTTTKRARGASRPGTRRVTTPTPVDAKGRKTARRTDSAPLATAEPARLSASAASASVRSFPLTAIPAGTGPWDAPMSRAAKKMGRSTYCPTCGTKRRATKGVVREHDVARASVGRNNKTVGRLWRCPGGVAR